MIKKNKNMLIVGGVILLLVVVGLFLTKSRNGADTDQTMEEDVLPDVEILPTVADTVKVDIKADAKKQEATLTINGVPVDTESIEYELSYESLIDGEKVPKGVIGTIEFDGKEPVSRKITLGTCSSGTCKYDKGITSIKASLKFTGTYGGQLYEGEFKL